MRIAKIDTLRREQDARTQLAQSSADAGTLAVRTYTLSYAKADQAAPLVKRAVLSPRGNVQIDARTNTLIITDLPARLDTVQQLLGTIDRAEPQVEVEARIIADHPGLRPRPRPAVGLQRPRRLGHRQHDRRWRSRTTARSADVGGQQGPIGTDPRAAAGPQPAPPSNLPRVSDCADRRDRAGAGIDQRRVEPRRRAVGARTHAARAGFSRRRASPRRTTSTPRSRRACRFRSRSANNTVTDDLQGRRADAEGHAADHRRQHRHHADHARELPPGLQPPVGGHPPSIPSAPSPACRSTTA